MATQGVRDQQLNNIPASFPRSACPRRGVGRESTNGFSANFGILFQRQPLTVDFGHLNHLVVVISD
jgi:hypothetical protein